MKVVYEDCTMVKLDASYIPGFLAFREVPHLVERVRVLEKTKPHLMPQVDTMPSKSHFWGLRNKKILLT